MQRWPAITTRTSSATSKPSRSTWASSTSNRVLSCGARITPTKPRRRTTERRGNGRLLLVVVGRAGSRRPHEQLSTVCEDHAAAVSDVRAVLRAIAFDDDLGADGKGALVPPAAQQLVRRAHFDFPADRLSVSVLDVDVQPGVRIDPLDLRDGPLQGHRVVGVEFRRERVV